MTDDGGRGTGGDGSALPAQFAEKDPNLAPVALVDPTRETENRNCPDHAAHLAAECCPACLFEGLREAQQEIARLTAVLADCRGALLEAVQEASARKLRAEAAEVLLQKLREYPIQHKPDCLHGRAIRPVECRCGAEMKENRDRTAWFCEGPAHSSIPFVAVSELAVHGCTCGLADILNGGHGE